MASIFHKTAKIAFKVAKKLDLIHQAIFKSIYDDGFDDPVITESNVEVIKERFTQDDIRGLMFRDKIQPSDIKLYVLGTKVPKVDTDDIFKIDSVEYTVFGCELDGAGAMWTVGVR